MRGKKVFLCEEVLERHREQSEEFLCDTIFTEYSLLCLNTIIQLKNIQRQLVRMTKYRTVYIVGDIKTVLLNMEEIAQECMQDAY